RPHPQPTLFPYTTLFRSCNDRDVQRINKAITRLLELAFAHKAISSPAPDFEETLKSLSAAKTKDLQFEWNDDIASIIKVIQKERSEEHTSELQSLAYLVC